MTTKSPISKFFVQEGVGTSPSAPATPKKQQRPINRSAPSTPVTPVRGRSMSATPKPNPPAPNALKLSDASITGAPSAAEAPTLRDPVAPSAAVAEYLPVPAEVTPRKRRSSLFNMGSPLPILKHGAEADYNIQHMIGEGVTSKVYLGTHKRTRENVAIKIISKKWLINNAEIAREVSILKKLRHPNIIGLRDVFITEQNLQIVMELCEGTELFDEIITRRSFTENDARELVKTILKPVAYLHRQGIVHRDIKPENLMFVSDETGDSLLRGVKLVDFGFARYIDTAHPLKSTAGTLGYKAPEVFRGEQITTQADVWSIGIITYILLCGFPPFFSCDHYKSSDMLANAPFWFFFNEETDALLNEIQTGEIKFPPQFWDKISFEAKDFVMSLLHRDPKKRYTAELALAHPWITQERTQSSIPPTTPRTLHKVGVDTVQVLSNFNKQQKRTRASALASSDQTDVAKIIEQHIIRKFNIQVPTSPRNSPSRRQGIDLLSSPSVTQTQKEMLKAIKPKDLQKYLRNRKFSIGSQTDDTSGFSKVMSEITTGSPLRTEKLRHSR